MRKTKNKPSKIDINKIVPKTQADNKNQSYKSEVNKSQKDILSEMVNQLHKIPETT